MPPSPTELAKIDKIVRDALSDSYVRMQISNFILKEDLENECSTISCKLLLEDGKSFAKSYKIEGSGNGVVDALLCAVVKKLSETYKSLKDIHLTDFILKAKPTRKGFGSDGFVNIDLAIRNRRGEKAHFLHEGRSLNGAAILVVQKSIEYFLNSELAIIHLKKCLGSAKKRNRMDLVTKYTAMMAELVKNMPYTKIIKEKEVVEI
tara:strand:+ start:917 stop:1534 length:618 start_codon:yes stop_codon:yes gene_type:complete